MPYQAKAHLLFDSLDALLKAATCEGIFEQPHLILGGGSNTIFSQDFLGTIISYTADKIKMTEDEHYYYLSVDAGLNWHQLVVWALAQGVYGLENLALIPGTVGAAPIQNIGAYGVEFADVCDFVEYLDKASLQLKRLQKAELELGYRDSVFKQRLKDKTVITKVGLKLKKSWHPVNSYHGLHGLETPQEIYAGVITQRTQKLPSPKDLPNAGSFFKNPIIDKTQVAPLQQIFPEVPVYPVDADTQKVSAAWLIEQCGFKGKTLGGVGVYQHHALILVNHGNGSGQQLLALIDNICAAVKDKFKITLVCEVQVL